MRWALKLSALRYAVGNLAGALSAWADLLTRWVVRVLRRAASNILKLCSMMLAPTAAAGDGKCGCPTRQGIVAEREPPRVTPPGRISLRNLRL